MEDESPNSVFVVEGRFQGFWIAVPKIEAYGKRWDAERRLEQIPADGGAYRVAIYDRRIPQPRRLKGK